MECDHNQKDMISESGQANFYSTITWLLNDKSPGGGA